MREIALQEPKAIEALARGADISEIQAMESRIGFSIYGDLRELLTITNGVNRAVLPIKIGFPGYFYYHMLSLKEAEEDIYFFRNKEYFDEQSNHPYYPLFTDNMGNYILIDTLNNNCVMDVDTDTSVVDSSSIIFRSIPSMLKCLADFYREGAFYASEAGEIECRHDLLAQIGWRNEHLEFWRR